MRLILEAAGRKMAKYINLIDQAQERGYRVTLIRLQVGSRGVPDYERLLLLAECLNIGAKDVISLMKSVIKAALTDLFQFGV